MGSIHPIYHPWEVYFLQYLHSILCYLALLGSKAQRSIGGICSSNLASFLGFLRFLLDLFVQDSLWIYLWPCGLIRYLCSEGGILHYSSRCNYTTLLNQAPRPKGSAGTVCWLGVFSVGSGNNRQLWQHQERVLFPFMEAWDSSFFLCFGSTATY